VQKGAGTADLAHEGPIERETARLGRREVPLGPHVFLHWPDLGLQRCTGATVLYPLVGYFAGKTG